MTDTNMESIKKDFLIFCTQDWAGLWVLIRFIREAFPSLSKNEWRDKTLTILQDLLKDGLILAGEPAGNAKFTPWESGTDETTGRIRNEWIEFERKLGRLPNIGDIVWFEITQKGLDLVASWEKKT